MKKYLLLFLIFFVSICFGEETNYQQMSKELRIINSEYVPKYRGNPLVQNIMDKTMKYRLDPTLGKGEYVTKDEQQGLKEFEGLQTAREKQANLIYKKYQSKEYCEMMIEYDKKREVLREQLINKKITWRQFSDTLEDLIIRNRAKESEYRDQKTSEGIVS